MSLLNSYKTSLYKILVMKYMYMYLGRESDLYWMLGHVPVAGARLAVWAVHPRYT